MKPGELEALFESVEDRNPEADRYTLDIVRAALRQWLERDARRRAEWCQKEWEAWGDDDLG